MRNFFLILCVILACIGYFIKGFDHLGISLSEIHPLDRLISKNLEKIDIENFQVITPHLQKYKTGFFLDLQDVSFFSEVKRDRLQELEKDLSILFKKVVSTYNQIPEIRPYLKEFPIGAKDISLSIKYGPKIGEYYRPPYFYLSSCDKIHKKVDFRKWVHEEISNCALQPIFLQKGLERVASLKRDRPVSIPRSRNRVSPLFIDGDLEQQRKGDKEKCCDPIAQRLAKKFQLHISALKNIATDRWGFREISSAYWAHNLCLSLEDAQKFSENFIKEYLEEVSKAGVIEKRWKKNLGVLKIFKENLDWFCFRITFWDEFLNRVEAPYIAQIQCQDGKIFYFAADKGQNLYQVHEEIIPTRFFRK